VSFFDEALEAGDASLQPAQLYARPTDRGPHPEPPRDWVIPTIVPLGRRLAQSASAVVCLDAVQCWPEGLSLSIRALMRRARGLHGVPPSRLAPSSEGLHIGVVFADGRRAAYVDGGSGGAQLRQRSEGEPVLVMGVGSMWGQFHRMVELYLSPLPPEGPLTVVVQWLEHDIGETRFELDTAPLRAAAASVTDVWPDLPLAPAD